MTQGLHFLVGREPLGLRRSNRMYVRYRGSGQLVSETYRKIRNGKFQTEGLPHGCR